MGKEDMQKLVEEIVRLRLQAAERSDYEDYGGARSLDQRADVLERSLRGEGYTLEDDLDDIELIHVLSNGTRYASFHLGDWQWQ